MMAPSLSLKVMATFLSPLLGALSLETSSSTSAQQACYALKGLGSFVIQGPSGTDYYQAKTHYWSSANADDTPTCVAFPTNAEHVSKIVKVLQQYTDVDFAMKSGGHNPNRGFSSVDGGVLISFNKLNSTTYDPDSQAADIGPGSVWADAVGALEPYGVTVVGGRIGRWISHNIL